MRATINTPSPRPTTPRERWSLAVDEFRSLLKDHPEHRSATKSRFFLAEALMQLGRYDEAQAQFRDFLSHDPKSSFAAQALFRAGEAAFLAGHSDAARPALTEFRAKYPDDKLNAYVLNYLGQLALADGEAAAAADLFSQSLAKFPTEPPHDECRFGLARARELGGQSDEAEKLYRQMADGADAALAEQSLLRLGTLQVGSGHADRAVATFEAFEKKYPKSPDFAQARLEHARALYQGNHFDQARAILDPIVADGKSSAGSAPSNCRALSARIDLSRLEAPCRSASSCSTPWSRRPMPLGSRRSNWLAPRR